MAVVAGHMKIGIVADRLAGIGLELVESQVGFGLLVEQRWWWLEHHKQHCTVVGTVVDIGQLVVVVGHMWIDTVAGTLVDIGQLGFA